MNQAHVSSRLLSGLAALGVGDVGASSVADEVRSGQTVGVFVGLCQREGHLHENQLCERRPRSRVDRFADEIFDRRNHAAFQRQFVALGEREQSGCGQVWLGTRLRSVFRFRVGSCGSRALHRESGRASSKKRFRGRIETFCGTIRLGMARGLKPLKRFQYFSSPSYTSLKRGVNESGSVSESGLKVPPPRKRICR
jgi:hypothetical protein